MCGIAGVVGSFPPSEAESWVRKMMEDLARRGPDSEGIELWDGAVFGHRRLAIFDLSHSGHQPMVSPDRSLGVVFNGSIYNYRELRQELLDRGYTFNSDTDTEVLIHGYREWGIDKLVLRLRGMFSFGLWDEPSQKLYLVRDRLGVKPLAFLVRNGAIVFASTVRALRSAGLLGELDMRGVLDFLEYGFVSDEHSIYQAIIKVPAATIVEWGSGSYRMREYWTPPTETSNRLSFADAVEETERLFLDAVSMRLYAHVPVGALLSGGIDSALVCWAISKLGGNITAYTIGVPGDPWDETKEARETASAIGIDHCVLEMSDNENVDLDELIAAYAEPFAAASALGMLQVSRAVAASAKVLLTGEGGDDVFLGYPRHRHLWLAEKLARLLPKSAANLWPALRSGIPRFGPLSRGVSFLDYATGGLPAFVSRNLTMSYYKAHHLLGPRFQEEPMTRISWSTEAGSRALSDYLVHARKSDFVGEYMTKVDCATMYYALEARSPFLDHHLWEFASSLPFNVRLHNGGLKAILRQLARKRIGHHVANRKKRGFGIPVQRWLGGRWREKVESVWGKSLLASEGWINSEAVLERVKLGGQRGEAPCQLWYLFVLELWLRHERAQSSHQSELLQLNE